MAQKTPFKVMAKLQVRRTDNQQVIERNINLSSVVEDAIVNHLVSEFNLSSVAALSMIDEWRIHTIWIDEIME